MFGTKNIPDIQITADMQPEIKRKNKHHGLIGFTAVAISAGALVGALYVASPSSYRKYIGDPVNSLLVKTGIEKAVPKGRNSWPAAQITLPAHADETETLSDAEEPVIEETPEEPQKETQRETQEETLSDMYTAQYLESEEGIKMTQQLLAQAGFDYIIDDGKVGPKTRQAVSDFRATAGLPDGENIDQELILALQEYVDYPQEPTQDKQEQTENSMTNETDIDHASSPSDFNSSTEYLGMTVSAEMIGSNQVKLTFDNNTSTAFSIGGWGRPYEACLKTTAGEYWTKIGSEWDHFAWDFGMEDYSMGYHIGTHSSDETTLSFENVQGDALSVTIHEITSLVNGLPTFGTSSDVTVTFS